MIADPVQAMFAPRSIAVVGASSNPAKIGGRPVDYLKRFGYEGAIYPINPTNDRIQGLRSYASVTAIGAPVDLAIISVSAANVIDAIQDCAAAGVRACVILSSGFAEIGPDGAALQRQLTDICQQIEMALLGPNCVGFMVPRTGVTATFITTLSDLQALASGSIALLSQSGALAAHLQAELADRGLGLSALVTTGNEAGLAFADVVSYLAGDEQTRVICGYLEAVRNADRLLAAIRGFTELGKTVVLVKAGVSRIGAVAASSHTGSMARPGPIAASALRQAGAVVVRSLDELLDTSELAALAEPPTGHRVGMVGISGGTGVLLADAVEENHLSAAVLDDRCVADLHAIAPDYASVTNPVDLTGRPLWDPPMVGKALQAVLGVRDVDIAVVNLSSGIDEHVGGSWIEDLSQIRTQMAKPIVATWLSGRKEHVNRLRSVGVPTFTDPARCIRALAALAPQRAPSDPPPSLQTTLTSWSETRTKRWLADHGLPVAVGDVAKSPEECVGIGDSLGYPVVLKARLPSLTHKTDVGGVAIGLADRTALRRAIDEMRTRLAHHFDDITELSFLVERQVPAGVEVIVSAVRDEVFGWMVALGVGGTLVELIAAVAWRRPPLSRSEIESMIDETSLGLLLRGTRGQPTLDRSALVDFVGAFAGLLAGLDEAIRTVELNPVIVGPRGSGVAVVDALATVD